MAKYYFPCGERIETKIDVGHALGLLIAQKGKDEEVPRWRNDICKECKRNCTITNFAQYYNKKEYKDTMCIAYSKEYLENKDKPTLNYLYPDDIGKYCIEIIIQSEDYRAVLYEYGVSQNVGLLSLIDEYSFEKFYNKKEKYYSIFMTSLATGNTQDIEFESIDEIINSIVSVRFVKEEK